MNTMRSLWSRSLGLSHPVRYDGEAPKVRLPPQKPGAQSEEILKELGYDAQELELLYAEGGVCVPA